MIETKDRPRSMAAAPQAKRVRKVAEKKPSAMPDAPLQSTPPTTPPSAAPFHGIIIGVLQGFDAAMQALVGYEGNPAPAALPALALAALDTADIGKAVALQFERGDLMRPVIIGLLYGSPNAPLLSAPALQVTQDGADVTLTAHGRLTLQCGRASLTLDVNGDIELRGHDVLSRASGQNRIKGSSISLN